jgi:formylglycine-generating enzyme required for sulfatase activity
MQLAGCIFAAAVLSLSLAVPSSTAAIVVETVPIGNPGNPNDQDYGPGAFGAVTAFYAIGKYEVTLTQYTAFLNAIAATDTYGVYSPALATDLNVKGIIRSGVAGSYTYSVFGDGSRPVTYVSWYNAARFTNWLQNGQPVGLQGPTTTEQGAYTMNGNFNLPRNADARYWIPSETEWYKAAYYQPLALGGDSDGYWLFPTQSNSIPGNVVGGSPNLANYYHNSVFSVTQSGSYSSEDNYLSAAGAYSGSSSYYGTFDQGGNVIEWTEGITGSKRILRGGSFVDEHFDLQARYSDFEDPVGEARYIGFRIAASVPEPATGVILPLASVLLSLRGSFRRHVSR